MVFVHFLQLCRMKPPICMIKILRDDSNYFIAAVWPWWGRWQEVSYSSQLVNQNYFNRQDELFNEKFKITCVWPGFCFHTNLCTLESHWEELSHTRGHTQVVHGVRRLMIFCPETNSKLEVRISGINCLISSRLHFIECVQERQEKGNVEKQLFLFFLILGFYFENFQMYKVIQRIV